MALRENAPEFKPLIESGALGLPCLVIGDNERLIFDEAELDKYIAEETAKTAE
ncbi:MAG: hypothetical protein SOZ40_05110 [Ezakiella sp.]|nr:hypothetical protein [Bacillota bacterium]MDY3947344.1 hypothetical protein [Ezakiella sp.]